jgi:hypothetical protein
MRQFIFGIVRTLNTLSVASMPAQAVGYRGPQLTLRMGDYNANGASISSSRDGIKFAVTIGPISDATVTALEGAARNHERICLLLPDPLLLDLMALEHKGPQRVQIVGRIVDPFSMSDG